ncbi:MULTISPECIES: hypothetical protein [Streptomyces]|nr:hypothetical protein [Streptomyces canarius]
MTTLELRLNPFPGPKKDIERAVTRQAADSQRLEKECPGFLNSEKELGWL